MPTKEQKRILTEERNRIKNLIKENPNAFKTVNIHNVNKHFLLLEYPFLKDIMEKEEIYSIIKYIIKMDRTVRDVKKEMKEENQIDLTKKELEQEEEMVKILEQEKILSLGYEVGYSSNRKKLETLSEA